MPQEQNTKVVWRPLPGSQTLAMSCPADTILYHGTRGPGKTDSQLMRFRRNVGLGYGQFWRGIIFDREYKNLDDLISKSMRWFPQFGDGARFVSSKSDYKWRWPTGEELLFRSIKRDSDYWNYHGQEFPFIGWNELTKYPNPELFDMMMSCNRSSFRPEDHPLIIDGDRYRDEGIVVTVDEKHKAAEEFLLPKMPLEVFATTNPFGAGHNWVKKRFINASPMGKILEKKIDVFNPQTQKDEVVTKRQVHIFGSYRENKYLPPEYIAELENVNDPNKKKAWLTGSWDIISGGMFDDVWDRNQHVIPPFDIPKTWVIKKSFDWGSSRPFSVGWWAISDGSDVKLKNGKWMSTIRGDAFRIGEWYGCSGKPNEGLRLLATEISAGIVEKEIEAGWHGRTNKGIADGAIFNSEDGPSIAANMAKSVRVNGSLYRGVKWQAADKRPGSRKQGWEKLREYFKNALRPGKGIPREKPGLFVFDTCVNFIDLVPTLPRSEKDPDDVDTESEDHIGDESRYLIASLRTGTKTKGRTRGT